MSVVLLDPRFPAMIPVESVPLLQGDVSYTEEVPVRVRWTILDLGGHAVDDSDVLVTTDLTNDAVRARLSEGEELVKAPSLLVEMEPQRQLEGSGHSEKKAPQMPSASAVKGDFSRHTASRNTATNGEQASVPEEAQASAQKVAAGSGQDEVKNSDSAVESSSGSGEAGADKVVEYSGGGVVDGTVVGTDEHTVAVAGMRRTQRTEVPASVMDEIEDAVALMARAHRQGEWEQSMTHSSLIPFLREETEELARIVDVIEHSVQTKAKDEGEQNVDAEAQGAEAKKITATDTAGSDGESQQDADNGTSSDDRGDVPQWLEQELCMELSDVLLQVLFHAEIANRRGAFDIGHVAGAFVAKLRSRAPYLFESVERQVPKTEQDRLWEEGKKREREEREKSLGADGPAYVELINAKDDVSEGAREHAGALAKQKTANSVQQSVASSSGESGLQAAENVIRDARKLGLSDSEIPMDIRYPLVGLEMDKPGEADRRLKDAVQNFREALKKIQN
ncbi:MazG nucleotide pyrophosphohydrolase domain-containing protein [Corynebacterium anserum]|uniref:MazG nucleotide pyrophosphohydrolase domain-containing protein n=1 Tax=Corynebacterium anserum TaxID=2684406 RepID=UPI001639D84C|nr:MazG nucleotide pyrophosphohydrolase domain-containing protein [Corynebacterium anserum]